MDTRETVEVEGKLKILLAADKSSTLEINGQEYAVSPALFLNVSTHFLNGDTVKAEIYIDTNSVKNVVKTI